jgi:hypothetical protein
MDNYSSVKISGAVEMGRARVLWDDGTLKIFGPDGLAVTTPAERPRKRPGHILVWDVETELGDITLRNKCITCGGRKWWHVVFTPADKLWSESA